MTAEVALRGLAGGALIGLAAAIALLVHGRIAGIIGIFGRALARDGGAAFRLAFLGGLVATGAAAALVWPGAIGAALHDRATLAVAGVLVGFGATLGNGCTSGHGVCGLARLSPRSIVAVATFMTTAAITVAIAGPR